jgi:hypothetical protein
VRVGRDVEATRAKLRRNDMSIVEVCVCYRPAGIALAGNVHPVLLLSLDMHIMSLAKSAIIGLTLV